MCTERTPDGRDPEGWSRSKDHYLSVSEFPQAIPDRPDTQRAPQCSGEKGRCSVASGPREPVFPPGCTPGVQVDTMGRGVRRLPPPSARPAGLPPFPPCAPCKPPRVPPAPHPGLGGIPPTHWPAHSVRHRSTSPDKRKIELCWGPPELRSPEYASLGLPKDREYTAPAEYPCAFGSSPPAMNVFPTPPVAAIRLALPLPEP